MPRASARGAFAWVCAGLLAASLGLAGCAGPSIAGSSAALGAAEVAPGVYMVRGAGGQVEPDNLGRVGNAGFIVGERGVIAVDTGTSYRHGAALLQAIRRVTDKPVLLALVTHTRQEFLFGATAFRERGIPIRMHSRAAQLMAARCEGCLRTLRLTLGDEAMRGSAMFKPDQVFELSHTLASIGRPVQVLYFGHASGPGDVAVFDAETGVLFAGGLLDQGRIPDVLDSDLNGWKQALSALRGMPIVGIVPGHGPLAGPALINTTERYLTQLEARLKTLLDAGAALSEVPDAAGLAEFQDWDQYNTIHRRNASVVFLRLELQQLLK